jgi:hypothetical protein
LGSTMVLVGNSVSFDVFCESNGRDVSPVLLTFIKKPSRLFRDGFFYCNGLYEWRLWIIRKILIINYLQF